MTRSIAYACPLSPSARRLALLALVISAAGAANAAICRVSPAGTGNGGTWAAAAPLQSALADTSCDEIWARQGTYLPTTTADRSISFAIDRPLKLYGGFAGGETLLAQRSGDNRLTVLSGDIGVAGDNTDNSRHVVVIGAAGNGVHQRSDTVIDGLSIVGGNVFSLGQYSESQGGGLLCRAIGSGRVCSPTLSNVLFSGNSSVHSGGALASMAGSGGVSSPLILQSTFTGNTATNGGGAVFVWAGTASTAIQKLRSRRLTQMPYQDRPASAAPSFCWAIWDTRQRSFRSPHSMATQRQQGPPRAVPLQAIRTVEAAVPSP